MPTTLWLCAGQQWWNDAANTSYFLVFGQRGLFNIFNEA